MMGGKRYVLLDRDGTVIAEKHYLADPDEVEILPGAADGLRAMLESGRGLVLVTNQSGLGRGYFDQATLTRIHERMLALLAKSGVEIERIYVCPHVPEDDCWCRKPKAGLAAAAAAELGFSLTDSVVVGDKACDIELGKNIGACTILVRTGYGGDYNKMGAVAPDYVADDLVGAAQVVSMLGSRGRLR